MTALVLPIIIGVAGLALDSWRRNFETTKLQEAADAAALGSLRHYLDNGQTASAEARGMQILEAQALNATLTDSTEVTINPALGSARVDIGATLEPTLAKLFGVSAFDLRIESQAVAAEGGAPICILALNPSTDKALEGSGGSSFEATNCRVQVNSTDASAVNLSGGSSINSSMNCFTGGVQSGLSNISPAPVLGCPAKDDPFAALPTPLVGACDHVNYSDSGTVTLNPGVYCGGIEFSGGATVTFNPGLYIIRDGELRASGGGSIDGDGVSFFLTGVDVGVNLSGGTLVDVTAMSTGSLAGFVFFLDPSATPLSSSHISGGGDIYYEGVFYFPNQELIMSGTGAVTTPSPFVAYVADTITYTGGSMFEVDFDESAVSVPIPSGLRPKADPYLFR